MEKGKLTIMAVTLLALVAFLLPVHTNALVPYTRSIWDMMLPPDDPFKILEHSPLGLPRGVVDDNALALARADWRETPVAHEISLDIPGMKKEDIKIEVDDHRVLRVSGERKTEEKVEDERWHRVERTVGKFWRQFRLPANADMEKVTARLENGVLRISVGKLAEGEKKREPKVISIVSDEEKNSGGDVVKPSKQEL
ncbi:UNVERIFIED_CONTAM: heat shock protein [Sesamum radiatum]|uniref:Heat shock protein n=1 Tax=Sesamum radiatum TaxID=300843 RepID=A0AAW2RX67_SESRA